MPEDKPCGGQVIYAKNPEVIAHFYMALLGATESERGDDFIVLEKNEIELVVLQIPWEIAQTIDIESPPAPRESNPLKPVFFVDETIQTIRSRITRNKGGIKNDKDVWEFRGNLVCDGWDPEGNIFQIRCRNSG